MISTSIHSLIINVDFVFFLPYSHFDAFQAMIYLSVKFYPDLFRCPKKYQAMLHFICNDEFVIWPLKHNIQNKKTNNAFYFRIA